MMWYEWYVIIGYIIAAVILYKEQKKNEVIDGTAEWIGIMLLWPIDLIVELIMLIKYH